MSDAQNVDLKSQDRIAQAGMVLVEQVGMSLLSDAYKFPEVTTGHMQTVSNDGILKIDGPIDEYVKTSMMFKKDDKTTQFGTWQHTESVDLNGKPTAKIDQVNMGFLLDVLLTNKMGSHTDFRGPDGNVQYQMDGFTLLTPKDGSAGSIDTSTLPSAGKQYTADMTNTIKDAAGNYLGDVHLMAKPKGAGNVLDITASYSKQGTYVGDIEAIITIDPNDHNNATIQIMQEYNPPPPPPPTPKA